MNEQNKFLLPDKSFWKAMNRKQRETLSSKYIILCPIILFTEIARHGLTPDDPYLDIENIIVIPDWLKHAKIDLLTEESAKPMFFGTASTGKSILENPEQELLAFKEVSGKNIKMLKKSEAFYRNLDAIIDPLKEEWLNLVKNTDNLESKKILQASIDAVFDTYNADSLENAYQIATSLFDHDLSDLGAAHDKLKRLCTVFRSILTEEEHTHIFNRFVNEDMPPMRRFAPYALGAAMWNFTIQLFLRENLENIAPNNVLRDAAYLYYTAYRNITFVSGDKWHKKFVDEVPLFERVRENFVFVDLTTKATIQEGFSKLL